MKTFLLILSLLLSSVAVAGVTKWVDANGVVHYSDQPPPSAVKSTELSISSQPADLPAPVVKAPVKKPDVVVKEEAPHGPDVNDVNAVPYLNNYGKEAYKEFLKHDGHKAAVITRSGGAVCVEGSPNPLADAMERCKSLYDDCEPYAQDDKVIWKKP
jgi:hypothetical protein